jgi:ABC-type branched-subunit amino acid transport system ATPase component
LRNGWPSIRRRVRPAHDAGSSAVFESVGLVKQFGGVRALDGVDVQLRQGHVLGVIGPNGSGKTTLMNCLTGVLPPTSGEIRLDGQAVQRSSAHELARAGVARTFQNVRLFRRLSVVENVEAAVLACGRRLSRKNATARTAELLRQCGVEHLATHRADALSYGDQRRVEVARALGTAPRFLLLDEPAAGMNEVESAALGTTVTGVRESFGCGVLMIEHDVRLISTVCEHVYVLNEGRVISEGPPRQVLTDPVVIEAYLGEDLGTATA